MNIHKNARLTPHSRAELVRRVLTAGQAPMAVATAMGVSAKTVRKWVERFAGEGAAGLADRSSRPRRLYRPTPEATAERIEVLRRPRWTGKQIARQTGVKSDKILEKLSVFRA
jgi:transposase